MLLEMALIMIGTMVATLLLVAHATLADSDAGGGGGEHDDQSRERKKRRRYTKDQVSILFFIILVGETFFLTNYMAAYFSER